MAFTKAMMNLQIRKRRSNPKMVISSLEVKSLMPFHRLHMPGTWIVNFDNTTIENGKAISPLVFTGNFQMVTFMEYVFAPIFIVLMYAAVLYTLHNEGIITVDVTVITGLFKKTETDMGNADDFNLLTNQVMLIAVMYLGLFKLFWLCPTQIASPVVLSALSTAILVISLPTALSLLFGAYIMNYLRGDSGSNSVLYAGIFDLATFVGFFKRFCIQLVRYILITIKLGLFDHFVYESIRGSVANLDMFRERISWSNPFEQVLDDFFYMLTYAFEFVCEIINLFIVYYAQFGAFVLVLFWLLKALYAHAWPIAKLVWFKLKRN